MPNSLGLPVMDPESTGMRTAQIVGAPEQPAGIGEDEAELIEQIRVLQIKTGTARPGAELKAVQTDLMRAESALREIRRQKAAGTYGKVVAEPRREHTATELGAIADKVSAWLKRKGQTPEQIDTALRQYVPALLAAVVAKRRAAAKTCMQGLWAERWTKHVTRMETDRFKTVVEVRSMLAHFTTERDHNKLLERAGDALELFRQECQG